MNSNLSRGLTVTLALITAVVHLFLGFRDLSTPFGIMFVLNGLGFLGLTGLFVLPIPTLAPFRGPVRWILIGYSALTFVLYFVFNGLNLNLISGITKAAELGLIAVLWIDRVRNN